SEPRPEPKPEPTPKPEPQKPVNKEDLLTPDKAYKINYIIKQEDGKQESIANQFFVKPAIILEKEGKQYIQLKITNGDMVQKLSNKYGNALLIKKNDDGSIIVQLRVDKDFSDILLDMHITVPKGAIPGFPGYNEEHKALLVFD